MLRIKILNWDKYNGRKDVSHPTWFRIENNLAVSQSLFGLNPGERWVFIALCGLVCTKAPIVGELIIENVDWLSWYVGAHTEVILSALAKLASNGVVTYADERARTPTFVDVTRQDGTGQDKQEDQESIEPVAVAPVIQLPPVVLEIPESKAVVPITPTDSLTVTAGKKRGDPETNKAISRLIGVYVKGWQAARQVSTTCRPDISHANTIFRKLLKNHSEEKLSLLLQVYCQMKDPWFEKRAWDINCFSFNVSKVQLAMERGDSTGINWNNVFDEPTP